LNFCAYFYDVLFHHVLHVAHLTAQQFAHLLVFDLVGPELLVFQDVKYVIKSIQVLLMVFYFVIDVWVVFVDFRFFELEIHQKREDLKEEEYNDQHERV